MWLYDFHPEWLAYITDTEDIYHVVVYFQQFIC